jgi:histone acetyltransferase MYST1
LDEWIKLEQLDLDSVECALDEKVEDKVLAIFLQSLELSSP